MLEISQLLAQAGQSGSWFDRLTGGEIVPLAIMLIPALIILLVLGFSLADRVHRRNAEIALKRDMVDRGMSADEIERVLAAKLPEEKS